MIIAARAPAGTTCTIMNADCTNDAIATFVSGLQPVDDEHPAEQVTIHACLRCGGEYINAAAYLLSSLGADEVKLVFRPIKRGRGAAHGRGRR